jgi:predicted dehydrogenase
MSNDIGVAVIGAGMAGRAHAHGYRSAGTVFSAGLPPVRLVSVADINVVSVVVANFLHREIVEALAAAGKHVLCEKPLAPTSADAQAMIDAVDAAGVVGRVGFTFRRTPGIAAARQVIESGELGRPRSAHASVPPISAPPPKRRSATAHPTAHESRAAVHGPRTSSPATEQARTETASTRNHPQ